MKPHPSLSTKSLIIQAWQAAIQSVGGERATRAAIAADQLAPITRLLAVGKAAAAMCAGALDFFGARGEALVVTKRGHADAAIGAHPRVAVIEAGHPLPDDNSLRAGRAVEAFVRTVGANERLVMLVSGGASALVERLPHGVDLAALQDVTAQLLAGGYSIERVNAARMRLSRIKGGKLLRGFGGAAVRVYAISDVPGDRIDLIGGGIGGSAQSQLPMPPDIERMLAPLGGDLTGAGEPPAACRFDYRARIIASNHHARAAAAAFLRAHGLSLIVNREALHCDFHTAAQRLAADLIEGPPGAYLWGGEPTVVLPPKPGVGGRNQSLALALAKAIRGRRDIDALIAGTDGTDGPTNAAGALIDGDTFTAASGADAALQNANAGAYLARIAALYKPGPTGTNVMDLAVAVKRAGA